MKIFKIDFQRLITILTFGALSVGITPNAIAASSYAAAAGYTVTLTGVTDLSDNPVSDLLWDVGVEGIYEPDSSITTSGDGFAIANTTSSIDFLDYIFLGIGQSVSQTVISEGETTNNGTASSSASHGVYFQNIGNSSDQTLRYSFDYSIIAAAEATGDEALASASVSITDFGGVNILAEANADSIFGPIFDDQGTSGSFIIEVGAGGFTQMFADISSNGSAVSVIPVPAAAWLFGSGLIGLIGIARRKKA